MLNIFSCAYWPFVHLLWRNVSWSPLPSFFFIRLCFDCCWILEVSLYFLDINPLSDIWSANVFSHSMGLFVLLNSIIWCRKCLNFHEVQFAYFVLLLSMLLGAIFKKSLPNPTLWCSCPMFSFKSLIVLGLTFRSLIHLS